MKKSLLHKIEMDMESAERKVSTYKQKANHAVRSWKAKLLAIALGFWIFLGMFALFFYQASQWYDTHQVKFHSPVEIRFFQAVTIVKRYISPVSAKSPQEMTPAAKLAALKAKEREQFVERLYQATRFLESRVGFDTTASATHIYCQQQGLVNEVGYFPDGNRHFCFADEAEQKLTLTRWFSKRLDGMTAQEALCLYVTGTRQPMCKRVMDVGL